MTKGEYLASAPKQGNVVEDATRLESFPNGKFYVCLDEERPLRDDPNNTVMMLHCTTWKGEEDDATVQHFRASKNALASIVGNTAAAMNAAIENRTIFKIQCSVNEQTEERERYKAMTAEEKEAYKSDNNGFAPSIRRTFKTW